MRDFKKSSYDARGYNEEPVNAPASFAICEELRRTFVSLCSRDAWKAHINVAVKNYFQSADKVLKCKVRYFIKFYLYQNKIVSSTT